MKLRSPLVACLLLACAASCARFERISECRGLAQTLNGHMDEIEATSKGKETPETFAKLAKSYTRLADEVSALPAAKGAASAQVADHVEILRSAAKSSRDTSEALKAGARIDAPRKELDRLSRKDKMSAQKLEAYCHAP
ncbi:MAG TPA: hypothetical protein VM686_01155 [Polyangiaceae bacterium]|nr:hypothetical protein [Polyangiaceae bacterium]